MGQVTEKNWNILSNPVHHLLKYFSNRVETEQYIQKLIQTILDFQNKQHPEIKELVHL